MSRSEPAFVHFLQEFSIPLVAMAGFLAEFRLTVTLFVAPAATAGPAPPDASGSPADAGSVSSASACSSTSSSDRTT